MNQLIGTVLLIVLFSNCIAQEFELLEVEYARYPNASITKMDSIEANISEYQVSLLIPVLQKEKWTGPQIKAYHFENANKILLQGALKFDCKECLEKVKQYNGAKGDLFLLNLL